jgi:CheY-like chemotaxis protein
MVVREKKALAAIRRLPRLLVVEASPGSSKQLSQLLRGWGTITVLATTPGSALKMIREHGFAMILLSLNMPGLNGVELIETVRRGSPNSTTPVIALTTSERSVRARRALEAGANDTLVLPTSVRALARICWYWLKMDQYPKQGASVRNVE